MISEDIAQESEPIRRARSKETAIERGAQASELEALRPARAEHHEEVEQGGRHMAMRALA